MLRDLRPLFAYMRRYRWGYLWGTLSCIATNAVWVFFPLVLEAAIDGLNKGIPRKGIWVFFPRAWEMATNGGDKGITREGILFFSGLLVAIALVKGIFLYAQRWILIGISREIEFDLRNDLFSHLERQDSGFYQRYRTGDIMARLTNDLNAVRMLLGPALMYSATPSSLPLAQCFSSCALAPGSRLSR
jgi:ATP-binding cassette subfamily B multidrug efflux pump